MANNCLITQLKEVVNDDNLKVLGALYIKVAMDSSRTYVEGQSNSLSIKVTAPMDLKVISGDGKFKVSGESGYTRTSYSITFDSGQTEKTIAFGLEPNKTYTMILTDKYNVKEISNGFSEETAPGNVYRIWGVDCSDLEYSPIVNLMLQDSPSSCGKFKLKNYTTLVKLISFNTNVNFDEVNQFAAATNLQKLGLNSPKDANYVRGDIASLANLTSLTVLSFATLASKVGGTLESFLNGQVSAGRVNGTISFDGSGTLITYEGNSVGNKTINFGTSMVNPTTEETEQGWQVV